MGDFQVTWENADVLSLLAAALTSVTPLDTGWQARWGDLEVSAEGVVQALPDDGWEDFAVPGWAPRAQRAGRDTVWLRRRLPADAGGQSLQLDAVVGRFELFIGSSRVALFPSPLGVEGHGLDGLPWHHVALPAHAGDQWLFMRVRSAYPLAGFQGTPIIGAREELVLEIVRRDLGKFVVGTLLVLIGLLGLFLIRGDSRALMLGLIPFALAGGAYILFYTQLKQLVVPLTAPFWFFLWVLSVSVLPAAWLRFLSQALDTPSPWLLRARRAHEVLGSVYMGVGLVAWALLEVWPFGDRVVVLVFFVVGMALRVLIAASSTLSIVVLVRLALGRGAAADRPRARILLSGVGFLLLATWVNVLAALGVAPQSQGSGVPLGLFAVTVALAVLVQRAWSDARQRVLRSELELLHRAKEKEAMLRDLHDGIGSVTTNIRLLAELGKKDAARGARALTTIAELSAEGLAELRAFTQTLDDAQVTWPVLIAELRRFGGQLIEAHDKSFVLEASVDELAPAPGGVVTLALLRVFREALTNVVKHAQATRVDVKVVVTKSQVEFLLRDDGAGGGSGGGVDTGRGVKNMRARVEELGGALEVVSAPSRQLTLTLPLLTSSS